MASEASIAASVNRHMGKNLTLCDCDHVICSDVLCAFCAGQCINGLLMQLAEPNGNVTRDKSGSCGESFYAPACYPCVITDGCVCLCVANAAASQATNDSTATLLVEGYNATVRDKLLKRANADPTMLSTSFIQQFCGVCFCTPCHNAAIVRELRPPGYGTFWCAPKQKGGALAALLQ